MQILLRLFVRWIGLTLFIAGASPFIDVTLGPCLVPIDLKNAFASLGLLVCFCE